MSSDRNLWSLITTFTLAVYTLIIVCNLNSLMFSGDHRMIWEEGVDTLYVRLSDVYRGIQCDSVFVLEQF